MKIASWNVNSVRARLSHVEDFLRMFEPNVLCLQETKVVDSDFPAETFSRLGYETVRVGQRTYNGVAILSRHPVSDVSIGHYDCSADDEARLISATIEGVRVLSAYIPNGKNLDSPSFVEKLNWLKRLRATLERLYTPAEAIALCGDFNIARDSRDVFDAELMAGKIHFSPPEHAALDDLMSFGLSDSFRAFHAEGERFSWWDYRMGAFRRNRGLRIDYIFTSEKLSKSLTNADILQETRTWDKPSDHAPTVIEVDSKML